MIYLKTIFSAPNEIKYLKLNLREAFNHIDNFIICEFNRTHTGIEREFIFERYLNNFTKEERRKIIYIGADISNQAVLADDSSVAHKNEQLMRGYFASRVDLNGEDIIFSVDADEIIFGQYYEEIINKLNSPWLLKKSLLLPVRQYFYKINYLWEGSIIDFGPVACKVKYFRSVYPSQWRGSGKVFSKIVGCHFSWCLTIDEMITKLRTYAHHSDYAHLAKRELLEEAVKNKTYPFDPSVDFHIKVLNIYKDTMYYPKEIYKMMNEFQEVIG